MDAMSQQPSENGSPPPRPVLPFTALAAFIQQRGQLIDVLLQVMARQIMSNAGRQATSFFLSRGTHMGQALDSGGSDHIAGKRDDPIPVTTANGVVYATC